MNRPRTFYGKGIPGVDTGDLKGKLVVLEGLGHHELMSPRTAAFPEIVAAIKRMLAR
mgnify:CR=1 FL=1